MGLPLLVSIFDTLALGFITHGLPVSEITLFLCSCACYEKENMHIYVKIYQRELTHAGYNTCVS